MKTPTPTAADFSKQWTRSFAAAVRKAAGTDGRLTLSEAKALAKKSGAQANFADNALAHLTKTGKKSVSVDTLISAASKYVQLQSERAAGKDKLLSATDAKKLPADLKAEYAYLRGMDVEGLQGGGKVTDKKLQALAVQYIVDNAGGDWMPDDGKLWPALDSGEEGVDSQWLTGAQATRVADFLNTYGATPGGAPISFDPKKHALIAVSTSFDEARTYFALQNRADGKITYLDVVEMVDVADAMEEGDFGRLFPGMQKDIAGGDDVQASLLDGAAMLGTPDP